MKWFLELGPCWGGAATVTPAAITSPRQQEQVNRTPTRRSKYKATMHWKPKLHAILEDNYNNSKLNNHVNVTKLGVHMGMAHIIKKQSDKLLKLIISANNNNKVTKTSGFEDEDHYSSRRSSYPDRQVTVAPFSPTPSVMF